MRAPPGHADFLRPTPFAALRTAALGGAAVIINLSDLRCDALVVTAHGVGIVPLPEVTLKTVAARADTFAAAVTTLIPDAFRRAIRDLRDCDPRAVTTWAAYLHTGL